MALNTERDTKIVEHIQRYHLSTNDVIHRILFKETEINAVTKVTSRLVNDNVLCKYPLDVRQHYFTLSPKTARMLNEHVSISRAFGLQALVRAFGVLSFCANTGLNKFTRKEFLAQFPEFYRMGLPSNHYFVDQTSEGARLGLMLVDHGTDPWRLMWKIRHVIGDRMHLPAFAELIQGGGFVLKLITPTDEKKRSIANEMIKQKRRLHLRGAAVEIVVVSELTQVLMRSR